MHLSALQDHLGASRLTLRVQREGVCVWEAWIGATRAFVKATTHRASHEREAEILRALHGFALAPQVLAQREWGGHCVLVTAALAGEQLDHRMAHAATAHKLPWLRSAGVALGRLHGAIAPAALAEMHFWQVRDGAQRYVSWNGLLARMVDKWLSRINPAAADHASFEAPLQALQRACQDVREPRFLRLLHGDYIGRNILVDEAGQVSGILDYEAARVGDPVYDLAKIVWAGADFFDLALRNAFLQGWEAGCGETVPPREFLCYVGVQCLAAIAWTDTHVPEEGTRAFRAAAVKALHTAMQEIDALAWR